MTSNKAIQVVECVGSLSAAASNTTEICVDQGDTLYQHDALIVLLR